MLKKICIDVFNELTTSHKKYGKHGFNFSYSLESTWNDNARILILTINPQVNDSSHKVKIYDPESPFPTDHDFFRDSNNFRIRKPVQGLLFDLLTISLPNSPVRQENILDKTRDFAQNGAIIASLIPWRTYSQKEITKEMRDYALNRIWGRIFKIWMPELIITLGFEPFAGVSSLLNKQCGTPFSNEKRLSDFCNQRLKTNFKLRSKVYKTPADKTVTLLGLPHPSGSHGYCGYHSGFPECEPALSPIGKFIDQEWKK